MMRKIINMMKYYSIQTGSGVGGGGGGDGRMGGLDHSEMEEDEEDEEEEGEGEGEVEGEGSNSEYSEDSSSEEEEEMEIEGNVSTEREGLTGRKRRRKASGLGPEPGQEPPSRRNSHSRRSLIPISAYQQPIEQLNKNTGQVCGTYSTILEAAKALRVKAKAIYCNMLFLSGEEQPGKSVAYVTAAGYGNHSPLPPPFPFADVDVSLVS